MQYQEWIDDVLGSIDIKRQQFEQLDDTLTVESIIAKYAQDEDMAEQWLDALDGYVLRTSTDELFPGDHTKYLDIRDPANPRLMKGGMLVSFDFDTGNVLLKTARIFWTVKTERALLFQKPGKQARAMEAFAPKK